MFSKQNQREVRVYDTVLYLYFSYHTDQEGIVLVIITFLYSFNTCPVCVQDRCTGMSLKNINVNKLVPGIQSMCTPEHLIRLFYISVDVILELGSKVTKCQLNITVLRLSKKHGFLCNGFQC